MIDIPENVVNTWLSYYYAANSVGYLIRNAKSDAYAQKLGREDAELILNELSLSLAQEPLTPADMIRPYLFAMAASNNGRILKSQILELDARYTKWFSEYVNSIFRSLSHSTNSMSSSSARLIIPNSSLLNSSRMRSTSSSIIIGERK